MARMPSPRRVCPSPRASCLTSAAKDRSIGVSFTTITDHSEGARPVAHIRTTDGVRILAGGAHTMLRAFPAWRGAKLVVALSQGTPWLLVLRADLPANRGDIRAVKALRIGPAA